MNEAIAAFERLVIEMEDPFREGAEAWRLACLLLQPRRGEEAATFAQVILRRDVPDPIAVAWLMNFGRFSRRGRLRKTYHRELREERGSATMLIVLARLAAGRDHAERGAALIHRFRDRFPKERALLDAWAVTFDDPYVSQTDAFAAAARRLVKGDDLAPLVALMASGGTSVEDLVSGCDLLASRGAWRELDGLRERILSIGNPRAVEIAVYVALRVGKPADCLAVLAPATTIVDGGRLPRPLAYLRIKANEALGRYRPIVQHLLGLKKDGDDETVDIHLIEATPASGPCRSFGRRPSRRLRRIVSRRPTP